ncbi:MAG: tryptophan--tRNA ligase [Candidatus Aenigmarchaeota archaeon]|nr:tryptophan--tRNA ligase [Candidatus Aenigmarchaeota archaeon]
MANIDVGEDEFKMNVAEVEGNIDYEKAMKEFGIEKIGKELGKLKNLPLMYRRGIVIGHRDFGLIAEAINNKKEFAVLTGVNPSGNLHLGNKLFIDQALFLQQCGAHVYIPISNDETYVFKKTSTLEQATQNAYEKVIPDLIALGFDPQKTHIFISTQTPHLYELAVKLSAKVTFSTIKAIFGFNNETNTGQIFYAVMQSAHILFPQLPQYGGPKPVVVPIGIDQDPYMRLVRDIAEKVGMVKPSSTYHKFMPGLQGGKMSGSKPETCIYLTEDPASARKKIMRAFSGGAATLKEHREKGGNPDIDVACQYLYFMFEESDKKIAEIFQSYRSGTLHSGDVKTMLADKVEKFLTTFQKRREKAGEHIDKFMIE